MEIEMRIMSSAIVSGLALALLAPLLYATQVLVDADYPDTDPSPTDVAVYEDTATHNPVVEWTSPGMRTFDLQKATELVPSSWAGVPGSDVMSYGGEIVTVHDTGLNMSDTQAWRVFYRVRTEGAEIYHTMLFGGDPGFDQFFNQSMSYFYVPELGIEGYKTTDASFTLTSDDTNNTIEADMGAGSAIFLLDGAVLLGNAFDRFVWEDVSSDTTTVTCEQGGVSVGTASTQNAQVAVGGFFSAKTGPNAAVTVEKIDATAYIKQVTGTASISSYQSSFNIVSGDEVEVYNSGTLASTLSVINAPGGIVLGHRGTDINLSTNDIVQVATMDLAGNNSTWIGVVQAANEVPFSFEGIKGSCGAGSVLKINDTPKGTGTALFDVLQGQASIVTHDTSTFTLLEDSKSTIDIATAGLTEVIATTYSWGEVDYTNLTGSTTGTIARGEKVQAYFNNVTPPVAATQVELDAVGADPYAVHFEDFNSGTASGWTPHSGTWSVISNEYHETYDGLNSNWATLNFPMKSGVYRFDARVTAMNTWEVAAYGSFGVIWKYQGGSYLGKMRWGAYRAAYLETNYSGVHFELGLGYFRPDIGETFTNEIFVNNGAVAIALNGIVRCVVDDPIPTSSASPGLQCESPCAFDDFFAVKYE